MKKTITLTAMAISASTSFAIIGPPGTGSERQTKTYCLEMYDVGSSEYAAGSCDMSANNESSESQIGANGCAPGQISLRTSKRVTDADFPIRIRTCLPPNLVQL